MREYGQITVRASATIIFDEEPDDDNVKDAVYSALSKYGEVEILSYEREPWNEEYENEADVAIAISKDAVRQYAGSSWDENTGGDPGYDETDFELSESDIATALRKSGFNICTVFFAEQKWNAAA